MKHLCASSSLSAFCFHIKSLIHLEELSYMIRGMEACFSQEHRIVRSTNGPTFSHLSAVSTHVSDFHYVWFF